MKRTFVVRDKRTGDTCTRLLHSSGLEIRVMEMPQSRTAYAQFGTKFGSIHRSYYRCKKDDIVRLPAGIAHFLEHKLFEAEDGSISDAFGRLGASDNAYTGFDRTVFLFHTQRAFDESLELLLRFVTHPKFTAEGVESERRIIAQEIEEYSLDSPSDRLFFQLMENLYHLHKVREDVAGTLESIQEITPGMLRDCWKHFYNLNNMVLCCAGNITVKQVRAVASRVLRKAGPMQIVPLHPLEPWMIRTPLSRSNMAVGKTQFMIGFKSAPLQGEARLRESLLASLVVEVLAGTSSPLYQRLLSEGKINDTFSTDCFAGDGWFCVNVEGESDDPKYVRSALLGEIARARLKGLDEKRFYILMRAAYGDTVIGMNTPEAACSAMMDAYMWGLESPFARTELLAGLQIQDANRCLKKRFSPECVSLSIIAPEESEQEAVQNTAGG